MDQDGSALASTQKPGKEPGNLVLNSRPVWYQHRCTGHEAGQRAEALRGGPTERGAWRQEIGALENQRKDNKSRRVKRRERNMGGEEL